MLVSHYEKRTTPSGIVIKYDLRFEENGRNTGPIIPEVKPSSNQTSSDLQFPSSYDNVKNYVDLGTES